MLYLTNAFSINMLDIDDIGKTVSIFFSKIDADEAMEEISDAVADGKFVNAIGHTDLARIVGEMLDIPNLNANRITVAFNPFTSSASYLIVAQYRGPRLPEGATELPEGATIEFWKVY